MKFLIPLMLLSACAHQNLDQFAFKKGQIQHRVHLSDIQWNPCPPTLPKGCEIFILEGHPKKAGFFAVRFKVKNNFAMPLHTHPKEERVTILSGKIGVGFGAQATKDKAKIFGPGDYYVTARDIPHKVWGVEDGVIQISGIGPWSAHFIE